MSQRAEPVPTKGRAQLLFQLLFLFLCLLLALALPLLAAGPARAAESGVAPAAAPREAGSGGKSDAATDPVNQAISDLLRRVEQLEETIRSLRNETLKISPPSQAAQPAPPPVDDREERVAQSALERTLIERSGLLLPPWALELEPSLTYAHASADNISIDGVSIESVLVIGEIISDKVRRNILIPALTFRLGLPRDFQGELRVPLRYESDRTVRGDRSETNKEAFGLGDIEVALSHQLVREKGWLPDLLGSLRWKTDSGHSPFRLDSNELALGTGYHALQVMLTALKVKEPAAFFGSLLYTANLPVSKAEGRLDPGDVYGFNLGLALALNLDTSLHFIWEQRFADRTKLNGVKLPGSALYPGSLRIGTTYTFTPTVSLDASLVMGLTRDAPDAQGIVAIPIRFH
jgi:hypothetical protein